MLSAASDAADNYACFCCEGWEFVNEGTDEKPKKGYVTNTDGSKILLRVRLRILPA